MLLNPKSINKILDLDHVVLNLADHTRCDFLIFTKKNKRVYVVPVELKNGGVSNAKGVVDQLQGGVEQANRWLEKGVDFDLIPILAHGKGLHKDIWNKFRRLNVNFRGRKEKVVLRKCGSKLSEVMTNK